MTNLEVEKLVQYWQTTAEHDYRVMMGLFKLKHYSDSLFYAHIVLEKMLKALTVKTTGKQTVYTHNLLFLAKQAELELDEKQGAFLDQINHFNVNARYPDVKLGIYKMCTPVFTKKYIDQTKDFYQFLCQKLTEKN